MTIGFGRNEFQTLTQKKRGAGAYIITWLVVNMRIQGNVGNTDNDKGMRSCIALKIGETVIPIDSVKKIKIDEDGVCDVTYFDFSYGFIYQKIQAKTEVDYLEFIYEEE